MILYQTNVRHRNFFDVFEHCFSPNFHCYYSTKYPEVLVIKNVNNSENLGHLCPTINESFDKYERVFFIPLYLLFCCTTADALNH